MATKRANRSYKLKRAYRLDKVRRAQAVFLKQGAWQDLSRVLTYEYLLKSGVGALDRKAPDAKVEEMRTSLRSSLRGSSGAGTVLNAKAIKKLAA
jgi:hypothetical protein